MLSEVPEDWVIKPLGEIAQIVGGTTPKKSVSEFWQNEDVLWATPTDITALPAGEVHIKDTATKASNLAVEKGGLKMLPKNTVLMTSRASIGYTAIATVKISTNQGFACFLPTPGYDPYFMLYLLGSRREQFIRHASGSTFKEISKSALKAIQVPLPPPAEQKRIAEVLSSVDESILATQRLIEQAERVKQGLMEELLTGGLGSEAIERGEVPEGWQRLTAKDLAEVKGMQTGPFGSQLKANEHIEIEEQGAYRVIMPKNIKNGQIDFESASMITAGKASELEKHVLEMGDVLFARRGDLSKVAIYYGKNEAICGTGCLRLRPKKELVNRHFLRFLFTNYKAIDWLYAHAVGATMLNLNTQIIGRLPVLLPPINQQEEISGALMAIEDFCFEHEAMLNSFTKLKEGLMDDLLTGKVRTV